MRALVSVSDKTGLVAFVRGLVDLGWEIIATGGTQKLLESEGVRTIGISETPRCTEGYSLAGNSRSICRLFPSRA